MAKGLHQPRELPTGTGTPIEYIGSTTGPGYNTKICSPYQVTWNVRPNCAEININSIFIIVLCSIAITIIVSIYPALKASKLDIIKSLKYE